MKRFNVLILVLVLFFTLSFNACKQAESSVKIAETEQKIFKPYGDGSYALQLEFVKGKAHNYPSLAIWMEDLDGEIIQTLFVTQSIASGYYAFGDAGDGKWLKEPGVASRPASLPYWLHRRELAKEENMGLPSPQNPVPDAYTSATPITSFIMKAIPYEKPPLKFRLLVEVNQPWDWNEFWNNAKYENDPNYHSSAQPSVIYAVTVDLEDGFFTYHLNPIGHGHYAGADGKLYTDISTLSSALNMFKSITLQLSE